MTIKSFLLQTALVVAFVAGLYFVLVRPQLRRIAQHTSFTSSLAIGDVIITAGGLVGVIVGLSGKNLIELELAQGVRVKATRQSMERHLSESDAA